MIFDSHCHPQFPQYDKDRDEVIKRALSEGVFMIEVVKYAPLEKILLETDAPYLAPVPFRGKRNEPAFVKYVAQKIAELKNLSYDEVLQKTTENTKKLFSINT